MGPSTVIPIDDFEGVSLDQYAPNDDPSFRLTEIMIEASKITTAKHDSTLYTLTSLASMKDKSKSWRKVMKKGAWEDRHARDKNSEHIHVYVMFDSLVGPSPYPLTLRDVVPLSIQPSKELSASILRDMYVRSQC